MSTAKNFTLNMAQVEKLKRKKMKEMKQKAPITEDDGGLGFDLEQREFIKEKMYELDSAEFLVLYLKFWEGFTNEEVTRLLAISKEKLASLIGSGLEELKQLYVHEFSGWKRNLKHRMVMIENRSKKNRAQEPSAKKSCEYSQGGS